MARVIFPLTEKIFFRNQPIRNKNCLWWPCLLTDRDKMSSLYRGPSIDASYQVSVHLVKRFQKRRFLKIGQSEIRIACGGHDTEVILMGLLWILFCVNPKCLVGTFIGATNKNSSLIPLRHITPTSCPPAFLLLLYIWGKSSNTNLIVFRLT